MKNRIVKKSMEVVYEGEEKFDEKSSFVNPVLLKCDNPLETEIVHEIEAFGPVNSIMPYSTIDEAIKIANLGQGSLVASVFTTDNNFAKEFVLGAGSYHGRIMIINKDCAKESTGHGSPMPHLTHGGPGRAGGGEEMGGIRGILKYMQRVALQGHPTTISQIGNKYLKGAEQVFDNTHPLKNTLKNLKLAKH